MKGFDLEGEDVFSILHWVHWMQTVWMIAVGIALLIAPPTRFGSSYQFIIQTPGLQALLAVLYLTSGTTMLFSILRSWPRPMALSMRIGGLVNWCFGLLLFFGAVRGPTGVLGPLFATYVGAHMLIQSVLLKRAM